MEEDPLIFRQEEENKLNQNKSTNLTSLATTKKNQSSPLTNQTNIVEKTKQKNESQI